MRSAALGGLLALLVAACGSPSSAVSTPAVAWGSVDGTVVVAPCRPVERAGDPPCPPRPGLVVTFQAVGGHDALTTQTDAAGHYAMRLPAAEYDVHSSGGIGPGRPTRLTVPAGGNVTLNLVVDSGIR